MSRLIRTTLLALALALGPRIVGADTAQQVEPIQPAQVADRWYLEPSTASVEPTQPAQVADRWYLEPSTASVAPTQPAQVADRWYLDATPASAAHARAMDAPSVLAAFTGALGRRNVEQLTNLFTPTALVQDGSDFFGATEVRNWAERQMADGLRIELVGGPAVGRSSGDPMPGDWILWSARYTRAGAVHSALAAIQDVKESGPIWHTLPASPASDLAPLEGSLAAIVQDTHIAYLSVRPHFLWMRRVDQEQSDELIAVSGLSAADGAHPIAIYQLTTAGSRCSFAPVDSVPAMRTPNEVYGSSDYIVGLYEQVCRDQPR